MSGSGLEALPDVRKWSRGLPGYPEWPGGPPKILGVVDRPSRMSECGRNALPEVWEGAKDFPDVREWCKALTYVRESSGDPPGCPGVVERPSRISGVAWRPS